MRKNIGLSPSFIVSERRVGRVRGKLSPGQLHEGEIPSVTAIFRRPCGAPRNFSTAFPALKRWANIRCAYGAKRSELLKLTTTLYAIALQLSLAGLAGGNLAVELGRLFARNGERLPAVAGKMAGQQDNLANVILVVGDLAVDGLHH